MVEGKDPESVANLQKRIEFFFPTEPLPTEPTWAAQDPLNAFRGTSWKEIDTEEFPDGRYSASFWDLSPVEQAYYSAAYLWHGLDESYCLDELANYVNLAKPGLMNLLVKSEPFFEALTAQQRLFAADILSRSPESRQEIFRPNPFHQAIAALRNI